MWKKLNTLDNLNKIIDKNKGKKNAQYLDAVRKKIGYENIKFDILDKEEIFAPWNKKKKYLENLIKILTYQRKYNDGELNDKISQKVKKYFLSPEDLDKLKQDIYVRYNRASELKDFPLTLNAHWKVIRMFKLWNDFSDILKLINRLNKKEFALRNAVFVKLKPLLEKITRNFVQWAFSKWEFVNHIQKLEWKDSFISYLMTQVFYEDILLEEDIMLIEELDVDWKSHQVFKPKYSERWFGSDLLNWIILTNGYWVGKSLNWEERNMDAKYLNWPNKGKKIANNALYSYLIKKTNNYNKQLQKKSRNETSYSEMRDEFWNNL